MEALSYYIADHLIGLTPWLNQTSVCSFPEPWGRMLHQRHVTMETPIQNAKTDELEGSYGSKLFADIDISSNSTNLMFRANIIHGILHSSSEKDRFVLEIVEPLEFALRENNTHTYMNVTFGRDAQTQAVNRLTLKLEVDLEYEKKQGAQIVG